MPEGTRVRRLLFNRLARNDFAVFFEMGITQAKFDQGTIIECRLVVPDKLVFVFWL